jgi:hypothetical protein
MTFASLFYMFVVQTIVSLYDLHIEAFVLVQMEGSASSTDVYEEFDPLMAWWDKGNHKGNEKGGDKGNEKSQAKKGGDKGTDKGNEKGQAEKGGGKSNVKGQGHQGKGPPAGPEEPGSHRTSTWQWTSVSSSPDPGESSHSSHERFEWLMWL